MKSIEPLGVEKALERRREQSTIRQLKTTPPNAVDFSSNDFLSLAPSPELRQSFLEELQQDPTLAKHLGSGGSRLLDGNSLYAEELERDIATFHRSPAGLLCNSGFDANVGLFASLPQPGDIVVFDDLIHASVHDGMRLSRAGKCVRFAHNDTSALRSVLQRCIQDDRAVREGRKNVFIAVEAVYSMAGDVAPLQEIVNILRTTLSAGTGHLIVDEAHSTGVFGAQGRGLVCQLGLEDEVTVRLHTFGKALACSGAILLCSPVIRQYLINYARPLIYTTFMPYPSLAAIRASYRLLELGKTECLAHKLQELISFLHDRLQALEASLQLPPLLQHLLRVPHERSHSAISYVKSSRTHELASHCQSKGFLVRGIMPPTVPMGTERVRICLHAGNTFDQIDGLVDSVRTWVQQEQRRTAPRPAQAKL